MAQTAYAKEFAMTLFHVRRPWLLVASLFVGILAIQAQEQAKRPAIPVKDWKDATAFPVSRIIDGDTVEIQDEGKTVKVRLIGVDTPETVHPSKQSRHSVKKRPNLRLVS
jgi:micrococcal nuclease